MLINPPPYTRQVKGLVLALVDDLTVLRLYIRLASPAIADGTFNSAVQVRGHVCGGLRNRYTLTCGGRVVALSTSPFFFYKLPSLPFFGHGRTRFWT